MRLPLVSLTLLGVAGQAACAHTERAPAPEARGRAEAARQYLVSLGVNPGQLTAISYGALRPTEAAHTEAAWAANRRDELHAAP
jgi:peptidoglycan-associated lipoprotein